MKLPRGVSGERLIHALVQLGYEKIRQKGSHVRLRHAGPPQHVVTIPLHDSLKTGTFQLSQLRGNRVRRGANAVYHGRSNLRFGLTGQTGLPPKLEISSGGQS